MDKAIDKIKKLLRLSKDSGASAHEAANALTMALKLATKHGIDLQSVSTDDDSDSATTHDKTNIQAHGDAEKYAAALVTHYFHTSILWESILGKKSVNFIGGKIQVELSIYAFDYIVKSMRQSWKNNTDRRLKRAGFLKGYFYALHSEMPKAFRNNDIVVCHDGYIEETFFKNAPDAIRVKSRGVSKGGGEASTRAGYRAAKKQGIRNALTD